METQTLPRQILMSAQRLRLREITEEARIASSFDGPFNFMVGGQLFDASVRIMDIDEDRWELALIGRNLTDKFHIVRATDVPFTGTTPVGTATAGRLADTASVPSRGREVMLRATVKFGQ